MKILLVDASHTVLHIVAKQLQARDHEVHAVADGAEALRFLEQHADYDALITSVELPSLSGFELCWDGRMLASTRRRPFYIIVTSSSDDETRLSEALDSGADDFMLKPVRTTALHARLRAAERVLSNEHELIRLASVDPLTGLLNRRAFFERARQAIARAATAGPLSAIMLDIDHFKQVNDRHGHDVGDQVIRAVGQEAASIAPIAGRLGGEEFALLLVGEAAEQPDAVAEIFRARCGALRFQGADGPLAITCSFGVADWSAGRTIDTMLKSADEALYAAKRGGRNRVVHAGRPPAERDDPDDRPTVIRLSGARP